MGNRYEKAIKEAINKKYEPLEFEVEPSVDDIFQWDITIGNVHFQCISSGDFEEQTSEPYALEVQDSEQTIPLLNFLKEHEEELAEYMERWK